LSKAKNRGIYERGNKFIRRKEGTIGSGKMTAPKGGGREG